MARPQYDDPSERPVAPDNYYFGRPSMVDLWGIDDRATPPDVNRAYQNIRVTPGNGQGGGLPWFRSPVRGPVTQPTFGQPGQPMTTAHPENVPRISNYNPATDPYNPDFVGPTTQGPAVNTITPPGSQPFFTGRDLAQFGIPAASSLLTTLLGTKANTKANREALEAQERQFLIQQAFLEQQQKDKLAAEAEVEAEKKRQFEVLEAEKRRRYDAREPWRQAGQANLTRMSALLDEPRPQRVPYTGNFTYRG